MEDGSDSEDETEWNLGDYFYELRLDLLEWITEKYQEYDLRQYLNSCDVSLVIWYAFLYTFVRILSSLSWFWWIVAVIVLIFNRSRLISTDKRLQLRHALAIANDREFHVLKKDIEERLSQIHFSTYNLKLVNVSIFFIFLEFYPNPLIIGYSKFMIYSQNSCVYV